MLKQNVIAADIRRAFCRFGIPLAVTALALSGTARAADPAEAAADPEPQAEGQQADTAAPVNTVVVSAQRRKERIVDVPISVTSVTAGRLEAAGVGDTKDLMLAVPGMRLDASGSYAQPSIRGVGSALAGPGMNSNIAIYIDGFYVPNLLGSDFDFISINSVDVLKGPQGTLFGRNATGGAILVNTREPSSTPTGELKFSYESFNRSKISAYASTGLSESVSADIAAIHERGDGFVRNIVTGDKDGKFSKSTVRAKVLAKINSTTKLTFTLEHRDVDDPSGNATSSYEGLSVGSVVPGTPVAVGPRETAGTYGTEHTFRGTVGMVRADFDLGFADLSSFTQYRDEHGFELKDYDSTPLPAFGANWHVYDKTTTQEFLLSSKKSGPLQWVTGLFYYRNKNEYPSFNSNAGGTVTEHAFDTSIIQTSYAAFADVTYEAAKNLFLTGGVRYGRDKSDASFNVPAAALSRQGKHEWTNTSPRAVVRYQLTPDSNVYASYSIGYKAGLIPITESINPVSPEKVKAVEVGYKIARGPFRFDLSAFNYDYTDMQVATYIGTISLTRNAANSTIRGLDAQLSTDLWTPRLKLNVGATYTKANYDSFKGAVDYVQDLSLPAGPTYGTFLNPAVDASGKMMLRTPRVTGNVSLAYHVPLEKGKLVFAGNYYRTSKFYFDAPNRFSQDGYGLLNLSATYEANDNWSFSVFGRNVSDEAYRALVLPGPVSIQQTYGSPRSWGGTISYHF